MIPLKVALFVKSSDASTRREDRGMGYWSYAVPEFDWMHCVLDERPIETADLKRRGFDLIVHEDSGLPTEYRGRALPIVFVAIDSTLSEAHYTSRRRTAEQADLVLVDHDDPGRFGKRARPFPYCVNDRIFRPAAARDGDVAYHCSAGGGRGLPGAKERTRLRRHLHDYCQARGLVYRSGALGLREYAASIAGARVCVNWPRTPANRPHRVFDTMACRTCLVTGMLPPVADDGREAGFHYVECRDFDGLIDALDVALKNGQWEWYAENGHRLVMEKHTWAIRARELRALLAEELKL